MKQTALYAVHAGQSVRMLEFQGWKLPDRFSIPSEEHHAVRTAAGLFDAGFLGRTEVSGPGALPMLQDLFTRDVGALADGAALFGLFCDEKGAVIDTALVFRLPGGRSESVFLVTSSPAASERLAAWLKRHRKADARLSDRTAETGQLALQGPRAEVILEAAVKPPFRKLKDRRMREMTIADTPVLVSRTGFTGERGYELFGPADRMPAVWKALETAGREYGMLCCGMTCREMLRIEAGHPLVGADVTGSRTPWECRLSPFVDLNLGFIGRDALLSRKEEGIREQLIGFELLDKGVPQHGGVIFSESREIGMATSGCHSPHRRRDIGLGYVASRYAQPGQEIEVEIGDREVAARIVELPFYRRK